MGCARRSAVHAGLRAAYQTPPASGRVRGGRHAEPCRISSAPGLACRLAARGRAGRAGRCAAQRWVGAPPVPV
ncbi:hypothetical protein G6F65_023498 [Rhizopus arrhizus]|nr:hypothetical protein G6F65_023498 [Rhizopus arrhizus]